MAEPTRMTQSQIIKELAETCGVNNKVSKQFLETFAEIAVRETKKKGVFILPGIGRLVRQDRKVPRDPLEPPVHRGLSVLRDLLERQA